MRGTRLFFLSLFIMTAFLLLAGCNFATEKTNSKAMPSKLELEEPAAGIQSLPCFKCHPYEKFSETFAHDLHRKIGLHCTQCHIIKSHKELVLNKETCNKCHNLTMMDMKTSSMPPSYLYP